MNNYVTIATILLFCCLQAECSNCLPIQANKVDTLCSKIQAKKNPDLHTCQNKLQNLIKIGMEDKLNQIIEGSNLMKLNFTQFEVAWNAYMNSDWKAEDFNELMQKSAIITKSQRQLEGIVKATSMATWKTYWNKFFDPRIKERLQFMDFLVIFAEEEWLMPYITHYGSWLMVELEMEKLRSPYELHNPVCDEVCDVGCHGAFIVNIVRFFHQNTDETSLKKVALEIEEFTGILDSLCKKRNFKYNDYVFDLIDYFIYIGKNRSIDPENVRFILKYGFDATKKLRKYRVSPQLKEKFVSQEEIDVCLKKCSSTEEFNSNEKCQRTVLDGMEKTNECGITKDMYLENLQIDSSVYKKNRIIDLAGKSGFPMNREVLYSKDVYNFVFNSDDHKESLMLVMIMLKKSEEKSWDFNSLFNIIKEFRRKFPIQAKEIAIAFITVPLLDISAPSMMGDILKTFASLEVKAIWYIIREKEKYFNEIYELLKTMGSNFYVKEAVKYYYKNPDFIPCRSVFISYWASKEINLTLPIVSTRYYDFIKKACPYGYSESGLNDWNDVKPQFDNYYSKIIVENTENF